MTANSRRGLLKRSAADVALAALLPAAARELEARPLETPIGMTQMGTATLDGPVQDGVTTMDAVKRALQQDQQKKP